jgi:hypothetical protein
MNSLTRTASPFVLAGDDNRSGFVWSQRRPSPFDKLRVRAKFSRHPELVEGWTAGSNILNPKLLLNPLPAVAAEGLHGFEARLVLASGEGRGLYNVNIPIVIPDKRCASSAPIRDPLLTRDDGSRLSLRSAGMTIKFLFLKNELSF